MKKLFFLLLMTIGTVSSITQAQIFVQVNSDPSSACVGDLVEFQVIVFNITNSHVDFNDQTLSNWAQSGANPLYTNPCGDSPSQFCAWMETTPASIRQIESPAYDFSSGNCKIQWWMRYGLDSAIGLCHHPDNSEQGVHLQYSEDNGLNWLDLSSVSSNPIGNLSDTLPFTTIVNGSGSYWPPTTNIQDMQNSTLYYWNSYETYIPNTINSSSVKLRFAQLDHDGIGYDSWGIDDITVSCPAVHPNVLWWNGDTNQITSTAFPSKGIAYDTTLSVSINTPFGSDTAYIDYHVNDLCFPDFYSNGLYIPGQPISFYSTTACTDAYDMKWIFPDTIINAIQNPIYAFDTLGTFPVTLSYTNVCGTNTVTKYISIWGAGMEEIESPLKVYYAQNKIYINSRINDEIEMHVYNIDGRLLMQKHLSNQDQYRIDISHLPYGTYVTQFRINNKSYPYKFVK